MKAESRGFLFKDNWSFQMTIDRAAEKNIVIPLEHTFQVVFVSHAVQSYESTVLPIGPHPQREEISVPICCKIFQTFRINTGCRMWYLECLRNALEMGSWPASVSSRISTALLCTHRFEQAPFCSDFVAICGPIQSFRMRSVTQFIVCW